MRLILRDTILVSAVYTAIAALVVASVGRLLDRTAADVMEEAATPVGRDLADRMTRGLLDDLLGESVSARQRAIEEARRLVAETEVVESMAVVGGDGAVVAVSRGAQTPLRLAPPQEVFGADPRPRFLVQPRPGLLAGKRFLLEVPLLAGGAPRGYLRLALDEASIAGLYAPLRTRLLLLTLVGLAVLGVLGLLLDLRLRRRETFLVRTLEAALGGDTTAFAASSAGDFTAAFRAVGRLGHELGHERRRCQRAQGLLSRITELLGGGVLVLDGDGEIDFQGRRAAELLDVGGRGELRERWRELRRHPALRWPPDPAADAPVVADVDDLPGVRPLRVEVHRLGGGPDDDHGYVVLLRDRAELAGRERDARQASQLRSFSYVRRAVGHDLKGGLNTIVLHLELLRRSLGRPASEKEDEKRRSLIAVLDDELAELLAGLERLLEQAAPAGGDVATFDVRDVLGQLERLLRTYARRQNVELEVVTGDEDLAVHGSPSQLRQALLDVAVHSLSTMNGGGHLRLAGERRDATVGVTIADDAPGIEPERWEELFDSRFTTNDAGAGGPLGVSRSLLAELGGAIAVEASGPRGTTYAVRLPAAPEEGLDAPSTGNR